MCGNEVNRVYAECAMRIARNGTSYWRGELENCPAAVVSKPARFLSRDWPEAAAVAVAAATAAAFGAFARGLRLSFEILTRDFRFHDTQ